MKYTRSVLVMRAQPIHTSHLKLARLGLDKADKLIIFLGSVNRAPTTKNPWDYETRKKLVSNAIRDWYDESLNTPWKDKPDPSIMDRVTILPLRDYMYNDYKWVSEVYASATSHGAPSSKKTLLIGCDKDDSSYYLQMFPKWSLNLVSYDGVDATDIREDMFCGDSPFEKGTEMTDSTFKFLREWRRSKASDDLVEEYFHYIDYAKKWDVAPFTPTFVTVDSLVIKSGCALIVKRKIHPGRGLWALPGGFLGQHESILTGAIRELREETGIMVRDIEHHLEDTKVFDHPMRSLRGRTITHAHLFDLGIGELPSIKAGDDAAEAHWVPLPDIYKTENRFFEDHSDIIYHFTSKY